MYYFTSPVLNKQKIMKPAKERDPYLESTQQNKIEAIKESSQYTNGSLWVQLLDTSDKGFKAATLNTFKKKKLC